MYDYALQCIFTRIGKLVELGMVCNDSDQIELGGEQSLFSPVQLHWFSSRNLNRTSQLLKTTDSALCSRPIWLAVWLSHPHLDNQEAVFCSILASRKGRLLRFSSNSAATSDGTALWQCAKVWKRLLAWFNGCFKAMYKVTRNLHWLDKLWFSIYYLFWAICYSK